jgi:gliding motility-associated protein GldC
MKRSDILFNVELDDKNIPEKIMWKSTDQKDAKLSETKSISISLWDHQLKSTLRIDLWTKEMPIDEMKKFYVDSIGGLAQSLINATGDQFMATEMNNLCDKLVAHLKKESQEE